jgi:cytochrome c
VCGPQHPGGHGKEEARGYKIEVTEETAGGEAKVEAAADISALFAAADAKAGGDFFSKKCAVCHNIEKGAANKVGPHLWGVAGRKVASIGDFNYSAGMKSHGDRTWSLDELNHFLWKPRVWVPGTIMAYGGTAKDNERANLIAYLNSQSDSPLPLPKANAPAKK